jgi:hypothetical protein
VRASLPLLFLGQVLLNIVALIYLGHACGVRLG